MHLYNKNYEVLSKVTRIQNFTYRDDQTVGNHSTNLTQFITQKLTRILHY